MKFIILCKFWSFNFCLLFLVISNIIFCDRCVGVRDLLRIFGFDVFKLFENYIVIEYCFGYIVLRLGEFF